MSLAAALLAVASLSAMDTPVLCSDLDPAQVSVVTGRVEQRTVNRQERRSGWLPWDWAVEYEIEAIVRPTQTLRGDPATRLFTATERCTAPWRDMDGRRFCSTLLAAGETDVFQIDRRSYSGSRTPERDEVADYDRRLSRPLPLCSR